MSPPTPTARRANPISYSSVTPGSYLVSAGAPHGFHFVPCHAGATIASSDAATLTISVPPNGGGKAAFFVDENSVVASALANPVASGAVKAAAVNSVPNTGRGVLFLGAVAGLVLVLLGLTILLALAGSTRRV